MEVRYWLLAKKVTSCRFLTFSAYSLDAAVQTFINVDYRESFFCIIMY